MGNIRLGFAAATAAVVFSSCAFAQQYPEKQIRMIVPFAPGAGTNTMARLIADQLEKRLGQPIITENRDGASGTIGSDLVAKAKPDGYTLLLSHTGTVAVAPHLVVDIRYDPLKDFEPVGMISEVPMAIVVPKAFPANTLAEFIDVVKKSPGKYSYASGGIGTGGHLSAALFASQIGLDMKHVPYRGAGPIIPDLIAGRVDVTFAMNAVLPFVNSGELKALAVATKERVPQLPNVPTTKEAGLDYTISLLYGIAAPAGTPAPVIERLSKELREVVQMPQINEALVREGGRGVPTTPAEYRKIIADDYVKWGEAVRVSGAKNTNQ